MSTVIVSAYSYCKANLLKYYFCLSLIYAKIKREFIIFTASAPYLNELITSNFCVLILIHT